MPERHLNIVSFSIPYPANYGGVIDVFYKLVALKAEGIKIHLHCFQYDRQPAPELKVYCESVHYYSRKTGFKEQLSVIPYIVRGRRSDELLKNLLSNEYPVLFEGLHSCFYLDHPSLEGRELIYRESNIEHQYYFNLFRSEKKLSTRIFFLFESLRLRLFQHVLKQASQLLIVSEKDTEYLKIKFPGNKVTYLPSFHGNTVCRSLPGKGKYAFYHGNLSVSENVQAAEFLIKEVFNGLDIPLIIAGLKPSAYLKRLASGYGIQLIENPSNDQMDKLIQEAQVNILVTFQSTGLKLKLLNTLFNGRFLLVNPPMVSGTGLDALCSIANTPSGFKIRILSIFKQEFDLAMVTEREKILMSRYSDTVNAKKMIDLIFPS